MPTGRDPLTAEVVRELLEEYRRGTQEVMNLRNDMSNLKAAIEGLTRAVRGGNGDKGLITQATLTDERVKTFEAQLSTFAQEGTPANQRELRTLETRTLANQQGVVDALAKVVEAKAELKAFREEVQRQDLRRGASGRQLTLFAAGQVVAVLLGVGAMLVAIFHR